MLGIDLRTAQVVLTAAPVPALTGIPRERTAANVANGRPPCTHGGVPLLTAITQRIYQRSKRRGRLAAARVVKLVSAIRRAPILEDPHEGALVNVEMHHVLRYVAGSGTPHLRIWRVAYAHGAFAFNLNASFKLDRMGARLLVARPSFSQRAELQAIIDRPDGYSGGLRDWPMSILKLGKRLLGALARLTAALSSNPVRRKS